MILLDVDEAALVDRLSGRFTCTQCGASYHERYNRPSREGVCECAAAPNSSAAPTTGPRRSRPALRSIVRPRRFLPYYSDRGILRRVDGMADIDEVTREIETVLRAGGDLLAPLRGSQMG